MLFTFLPCFWHYPKKREWISFKIRLSWVSGKSQSTQSTCIADTFKEHNYQYKYKYKHIHKQERTNMPDIQQEEIKFEKRKKQNTRNRPRGRQLHERRSQKSEKSVKVYTANTQTTTGWQCIDNDIDTVNKIVIALRIRSMCAQHFLTGQRRWRERRRRRKSGTCQNIHILVYYQLGAPSTLLFMCVCGSESEHVCLLSAS